MLSTNNVRPLMTVNMPVVYNDTSSEEDSKEENDLPEDNQLSHIINICLKVKLDEVLNIPIDDVEALKKYNPDFEKKF